MRAILQKNIANIISICRIVLLLSLFFIYRYPVLFLLIYTVCGLSDMLDGYVARKTKTESSLGAKLDSIADFVLFMAIFVTTVLWMKDKIFAFLPWITATAVIRAVNIAVAAFKYHSFAILHALGNKLTGFLVFIMPLFILCRQLAFLWVVCVVALLSAAEETAIHLTSKTLNLDRVSLFKM